MANVITQSGRTVPENKAVNIDGHFYIIGEEALEFNGLWYPLNSALVYKGVDGKYYKRDQNTVEGVYDYTPDKGAVYCMFQMTPDTFSVRHNDGSTELYYNKKVWEKIPKRFIKTLGTTELLTARKESNMFNYLSNCIGIKNHCYSFNEAYSSNDLMEKFLKKKISVPTKRLNEEHIKAFGDYSFGLEFETSAGNLSEEDCYNYGLIPLRDGSISGHEYTTIPLKGKDGFNLLLNQLDLLQKSCTIDKECSLHIHLGGFPIKEDKIWALYRLCLSLEKELKSFFHENVYQTRNYKAKQKDYCTVLHRASNFKDLYHWLAQGNMSYDGNLTHNHPQDREDRAKWNMSARYVWANLINLCFKNHGKTMEFRMHGPTFNKEKVINWLFICNAITQYADKHSADLQSGTSVKLYSILKEIYPQGIYSQLISYLEQRREFFQLSSRIFRDNNGHYDIQLDSTIEFGTNLVGK